jgi:hypothetical protein
MPNESSVPVVLDRLGTRDVVEILIRGLGRVDELLGSMDAATIEATLFVNESVSARWTPPILASGCHPRGFAELRDLPASEAFSRMAPVLHGLLRALETRGLLPQRLSELPGFPTAQP